MKFTFDTEFIEDGKTIDLISIAIINLDTNEELYLISSEFDASKADDWVKENVLKKLNPLEPRYTREAIKQKVLDFCGNNPEFHTYYAAYDWVGFCQLFGKMIDLPEGYPMLSIDMKQEILRRKIEKEQLPSDPVDEHNALADARWHKQVYDFLYRREESEDESEDESEISVSLPREKTPLNGKIFLGGTCNGSNWREKLIEKLNIEYFNPVVDDWTEDCIEKENEEKLSASYLLYCITSEQTGFYSIAELVESSIKYPKRTIVVFLDKDELSESQLKSISAIEKMIEENGSMVLSSIDEVAKYVNISKALGLIPEKLHFQETVHDRISTIASELEEGFQMSLKFGRDA